MSLSGGTFSEGAIVKGICGGGTDYWFIKGAGTDDNGYLEIGTQITEMNLFMLDNTILLIMLLIQ